jgi:hypothetical protein
MTPRIYLDTCCLNRLTDDQAQVRIREEAAAVERILRETRRGAIEWVSSEAIFDEVERNPDTEKRLETAALLTLASESVEVDESIAGRALELQIASYGA